MSTSEAHRRAILEALAYSDIFNYPLRLDELRRYLPVHLNELDLSAELLQLNGRIGFQDGYYFLAGRQAIVALRRSREAPSRRVLGRARLYGRVLSVLPFIRMTAVTGSLAVLNCDQTSDLDFMLVAKPGRLWTARACALALNRLTRLFGDTLCPNLIVSETALEWPLHDLYSARELCQMILVSGEEVYARLLAANPWVDAVLPNARESAAAVRLPRRASILQMLLELPLAGKVGDWFEAWEMKRKIARLSKQAGYGVETFFNADVCQGNFHHHRAWAREFFEKRLEELGVAEPVAVGVDG
jgi:hypothetical protein